MREPTVRMPQSSEQYFESWPLAGLLQFSAAHRNL
jgi:hypothetical protein